MKNILALLGLFFIFKTSFAQNPIYQQKLYYTCKVWGFVKYYHSKVSVCELNWDSVLMSTLPKIKNAVTGNDFNNVLYQMLQAAGPMAIATTPKPDTLPLELRRNLNFDWINDPVIRSDVKTILDTIKNNFRRHPTCWANTDRATGYGWMAFPKDDPIINSNLSTSFPDEFTRLMIIFKFWNIMKYFNPNNYILEKPWDSTLYNNLPAIADASNYLDFKRTFMKMKASLNDAHAEGLTSPFINYYVPRIVLRYSQGTYIVVKSGYAEIVKGDKIVSVDGKTTSQWEDSLRPYISAGNPSVFRRFMCYDILRGSQASVIKLGYKDSLGNIKTLPAPRDSIYYNKWFRFYPNDTLAAVSWKKWDCNIGYVNLGNLSPSDVNTLYSEMKNTAAIIIDVRNSVNISAWQLIDLMFQNKTMTAKGALPDVNYPGTYYWYYQYNGNNGNPDYYRGKVIILCNQETQSQAENVCMTLKAMPNSVVVGSQTAGADGDITVFKLSQNIQTGFTTLGWFYPDGTQTQRIGIVPDSFFYITPEGIRHGRDEVLEKAIEIAGCDTTTSRVVELNYIKNKLVIFPNPASDKITISIANSDLSDKTLSIFNSLGVEIKRFDKKELLGQSVISFSAETFPSGVYYCTMTYLGNKISRRFVVLR